MILILSWIPLGSLLHVCDAVIHHGGAGTTFTALDAGLPQLVLPQMADQPLNAAAVARSGAGAVVQSGDLDAGRLSGLLTDNEIAAQPTPMELVPKIVAL